MTKKDKFRRKKLWAYGKKVRLLIIIGLVFTLINTLLSLVGPYIISVILDSQLVENLGAKNYSLYLKLCLAFLGVTLAGAIFKYLTSLAYGVLANKLLYIIRKDVFNHVLGLPISFFDQYPAGKVVSRINNDSQDIKMLFQILLSDILTSLIFCLAILIGLFMVDYKMGLISLLSLPLMYLFLRDYRKKSTLYNKDMRRGLSDLNANLNENIQAMEIIQAYNNEDYIYEDFSDINDRVYEEGKKLSRLWAYSSFNISNTLGDLTIALATFYFALSYLNLGLVGLGSLYIFIDYNKKLYSQINGLTHRLGYLEKAKSAADQLFELLQVESYEQGSLLGGDFKGRVEFDRVNFSYKASERVLKDLSFSVKSGESAAFVGHTGSGKSTIMNLIYDFYPVEDGKILLDGKDIRDLSMGELRKQMAIVFQDPYIFKGTIYENISLFDERISKEEAKQALLEVGAEDFLSRLDKGIDSPIAEKGSGFSSGEKQLISFARALVRKPKLLVLDEATSNVDTETEKYIQYGVDRLKEGRTTLIIAHRLSTIRDVDTIYVLEDGRIIEKGNHNYLISQDGVYRQMYLSQSN